MSKMTFLYVFFGNCFSFSSSMSIHPKEGKEKRKMSPIVSQRRKRKRKMEEQCFSFFRPRKKTAQSPDLHRKKVPFPLVVLAHFLFVLAFGQVLHIYTYTTTLVCREEEGEGKEEEETISQRKKREGEEEKKVEWGGGRM